MFFKETDGSQPLDTQTDDREARNDFWTIAGNYVHPHHVEPTVKFYVPNEESFPIPLENIDVVRRTNTTLDVLLECRIDDYWNVDGGRELSEPRTGFTQFTMLSEKPPDGSLTKKSSNIEARLFLARNLARSDESCSR